MYPHQPSDKAIATYSLTEICGELPTASYTATNACVIVCDSAFPLLFDTPSRINAYLIGVCTSGTASVSMNMNSYVLQPGAFFTLAPGHLLQVSEQADFRASMLLISPEYFSGIHLDTKQLVPLSVLVVKSSFVLDALDAKMLSDGMHSVACEMRLKPTTFTDDLIASMISTLLYKAGDVITRNQPMPTLTSDAGPRSEEYFRNFLRLLAQHYKQERMVSFYAERLRVTPKYLTTLIKKASGRSVSAWIDYYVIGEAKTLLKYSDLSIYEIAKELNFPNQSFFGSYFRRYMGVSPSQYRMRKAE